jgi:hypothetical protein
MMLSDVDFYRAAHLIMHEYGHDAELEAARRANQMLAGGDQDARGKCRQPSGCNGQAIQLAELPIA